MQIEGLIGNAVFKEVLPRQNQTHSVAGPSFMEIVAENAARADLVVRGNQVCASGLSGRKMVEDWSRDLKTEEEVAVEGIFGKIARIDRLLKEKFSK